jgi:hypothetical protein
MVGLSGKNALATRFGRLQDQASVVGVHTPSSHCLDFKLFHNKK